MAILIRINDGIQFFKKNCMVNSTTNVCLTHFASLPGSKNLREIQLFIAKPVGITTSEWTTSAVAGEIVLHAENLPPTTSVLKDNSLAQQLTDRMENRTNEQNRTHGIHTALKVKDSKTGKVILKDNVFEDSKLECEINYLKLWQKKEESRLRWKKEHAIRDMRKHLLLRRVESNPELLNLPRIEGGGLRQTLRATRHDKKRFVNTGNSLDSSPEQSPHNSLEDVRLPRVVSASLSSNVYHTSETSTLPALLSPCLIRKSKVEHCTNDPRFKKLLQNLVPKP